jgi:hypothetical protein
LSTRFSKNPVSLRNRVCESAKFTQVGDIAFKRNKLAENQQSIANIFKQVLQTYLMGSKLTIMNLPGSSTPSWIVLTNITLKISNGDAICTGIARKCRVNVPSNLHSNLFGEQHILNVKQNACGGGLTLTQDLSQNV